MPNFIFSYRTPKGYVPSTEAAAAWMSWLEGMGDHLVELGQPVFERTVIGDSSPAHTELGGYSVIQAEDFDTARAIAKGCPSLDSDGGVEIGLLAEIPSAS